MDKRKFLEQDLQDEDIESAELLQLDTLRHNLLAVNISKFYREDDSSLYDATRQFWVLSPEKANQADFIVSEHKGVLRAIFKMNEKGWQKADAFKNRYFFEGEQVFDPEILALYLHKKIEKKRGQANPVRYIYINGTEQCDNEVESSSIEVRDSEHLSFIQKIIQFFMHHFVKH